MEEKGSFDVWVNMRKIKMMPHIPYYMADGNKVLRKWKEDFVDRLGNKAILTHVEFVTKKGKLNEAVIGVEWLDPRWCFRCRCIHLQEEVDPKKIIAELSQKIADDMDREILEMIRAKINE